MRYDLTVPFARWLAMNRNVKHIRRYQIAKVYRRDQPAIARGRLREFYQCDFDIAGVYDPMIPDAEILRVVVEAFKALELEDITIKLNHRLILNGLFAVAGVPVEKTRLISSAVDKLDKATWADVKKEMVEKGISDEVADRIGEYVRRSGEMREMIKLLKSDSGLCEENDNIKAGLDDMELLVSYLDAMGIVDKVSFDLSLARGLDYYSGLIYEVVIPTTAATITSTSQQKKQPIQVGSIAAGGRYDNLVGMYGKHPIPCVGLSFGVDRIFTILDARRNKENSSDSNGLINETDVYIIAAGGPGDGGFLLERMAVARQLWDAGIRTEFSAKVKPKLPPQFKAAKRVPLSIILGRDELAAGKVTLKDARAANKEAAQKDRGQLVSRENLVEEVRKLLATITLEQK